MSKRGVARLCAVLVVWALANTFVIHAYGRHAELFPMTAWQMFSGQPRESVRRFVFNVIPSEGDRPVEVEGGHLIGAPVRSTSERRILQGVWRSHDYGCRNYRLSNYRACKADPIQPWVIPRDIGDDWVTRAMDHLHLDKPPYSIELVKIEVPLVDDPKPLRTSVLTWKPASGSYRVERAR